MRGGEFDVSDVQPTTPQCECTWLRQQCRALLEQRKRAFKLGYKSGREDAA